MNQEIELLKKLMGIPSVTGNEVEICQYVYDLLENNGFKMEKIMVDKERFDIVAKLGTPKVYLSAHLDTVAPYYPFSETEDKIFGRGSCDTKSCVATMIRAGIKCRVKGLSDFGFIFTVGEEGDFDGAKKIVESGLIIPMVVVGEPTSLDLVNGHYGFLVLEVTAKGRSAHSSRPEEGENAIDKLLLAIKRIKKVEIYEETLMSVVKIDGGIADNIIPDVARVTYSFRIHPKDESDYQKKFSQITGDGLTVEKILEAKSVYTEVPKQLSFIKNQRMVKYGTDLSIFGKGVVIGPGDIKYAHGGNENIDKKELTEAVGVYEEIIRNYVG